MSDDTETCYFCGKAGTDLGWNWVIEQADDGIREGRLEPMCPRCVEQNKDQLAENSRLLKDKPEPE